MPIGFRFKMPLPGLQPGVRWDRQPFTYCKLCIALWIVPGLALGFLLLQLARTAPWFLTVVLAVLWVAANWMVIYVLQVHLWKILSPEFRQNIPYDFEEAAVGKGSIHSYRDIIRWVIFKRNRSQNQRSVR